MFPVRLKWVILTTLWAVSVREFPAPIRCVKSGCVRGVLRHHGRASYLGVPYATTDKEHRFKAPLPVLPWEGILEAVEENIRCPQYIKEGTIIGEEDCLRLNIHTNLHDSNQLRPVMVFIHGGGYYQGSGLPALYGPDYLVSKGVVLVSFNYRLNIQGYLCLRNEDAPGNAGMKDQVAALRWVRDNIKVFGGNPDDVTIFGESAGGSSVSYHLVSPMSAGLFHKAILQSGSSLAAWANQYNPVYMASLLAKVMGYNTEDPKELYNIFMNKTDADLVLSRVPRKKGNVIISEVLYTPCVERNIPGVEAFLTDTPFNILSRGEFNKVPVILGFNNAEGLLFVSLENDTTIENLEIQEALPKDLTFPSNLIKSEYVEKLKRNYLGEDGIHKGNKFKMAKFNADAYFTYPCALETDLILRNNKFPVFNYMFAHDGFLNLVKFSQGCKSEPGATHADEVFYLFKPDLFPTPQRFFEKRMVDVMTTLWTNFAKYGNPTPNTTELIPIKWNKTDIYSPRAFVIGEEFFEEPLWSPSMLIWKEVYDKYRRQGI